MTDRTETYSTTKDIAELRPCSATEALRRALTSIDVADEEEVVLSSTTRAHHKYFARVTLDRFEDLQVLGLVPRRLKQEKVRAAIKADDEKALCIAEERVRTNLVTAEPCNCHEVTPAVTSYSQNLRATYRQVRRDYNPALALVLSDHFGTHFDWDSTLAASVRGWTLKLVSGAPTTAVLFEDITIGRNGRLVLDSASTVLLAGTIFIHRTGTLIHRGGYLRIWANSIESFLNLPSQTANTPIKIWAVEP